MTNITYCQQVRTLIVRHVSTLSQYIETRRSTWKLLVLNTGESGMKIVLKHSFQTIFLTRVRLKKIFHDYLVRDLVESKF